MSKKTRSLNDVAVLATIPAYSLERSESRSVNVRKISNGYITCESSTKDGKYESSEKFTLTPPELGETITENPMKRALDYMNREGSL